MPCNLHFRIPGYVFLTMSFEKSPNAHSWLYIPGYVAHEISNIVFLAMSFLALACANACEPIPGYVECENPYNRFLAMYSCLCRVENLISIPDYIVPDYVEWEISKMWFLPEIFGLCRSWVRLVKYFIFHSWLCRKTDSWRPYITPPVIFYLPSVIFSSLVNSGWPNQGVHLGDPRLCFSGDLVRFSVSTPFPWGHNCLYPRTAWFFWNNNLCGDFSKKSEFFT
jgi:hypothetical protein